MRLLTALEVALILQVTRARVYKMARLGLIPCVHLGRQIRFEELTLNRWIGAGGSRPHYQSGPNDESQRERSITG
jgi:excisionase family DNA binding protein